MGTLFVLALTCLVLIPIVVLVANAFDRRATARRREQVEAEQHRVIRDAFAVKAALDAEAFRAHQRLNAAARRATERR
ncbi:MAG: hypothetical protein V9F04_11075 [Dermatophilaceae bacterium]